MGSVTRIDEWNIWLLCVCVTTVQAKSIEISIIYDMQLRMKQFPNESNRETLCGIFGQWSDWKQNKFIFFLWIRWKALKASNGFSSKWKWMVTFFLYVVESWPINEQASDRLLFFLSTAFDAGIINHLFILSIKYDKIITDRLFFGNHTTPLFGKSSNRCIFSLFSLKALHFTPTTRFYKSICIFFFRRIFNPHSSLRTNQIHLDG